MLPEVILLLTILLGFGFWKNRHWLKRWLGDYPAELKRAWNTPNVPSNYEMVKVTKRGMFSFGCMILFFILIFIVKPWWWAIIIFLIVYFGGGLLIGLQGGFNNE